MKQRVWAALACAALWGAGASAQAATATFEDAVVGFIGNGDSVMSDGLLFTQGGDFGGVADGATFDIFANAPNDNATQFFAAFNDSSVTLTMANGGPLWLTGLSYAFVSPIGGIYDAGDEPAALAITAMSTTGATWTSTYSFGTADADGEFSFVTLTAADLGALATSPLRSVTFSACSYAGGCVSPYFNQNQFALDNVMAVPEPAALVLGLMGLGVVGGAVRRRRATA